MEFINLLNRRCDVVSASVVSKEDFARISRYRWHLSTYGYAVRNKKKKTVFMHRTVMRLGKRRGGIVIDHINGNKLDNRRCNLRAVGQSENILNGKMWRTNTSGCKGVSWHSIGKKWCAEIKLHRKKHYLGLFKTIEAARCARLEAEHRFGLIQRKAI